MGCAFGYVFPLPLVTLVGHRRHLHGRVPALLLPEISKKCSEHVLFSNWSCGKTPWTFSKFWRCHGMEGYVSHPPVASCMGSSSWPTSQLKPSLNTLQVAMSWWKWGMPTNLGSCDPRTNEMKSMAINHQPIIGMDIPSQSSKQWEHVACIGCCSGGVKNLEENVKHSIQVRSSHHFEKEIKTQDISSLVNLHGNVECSIWAPL